ncbi:MAG: 16S rRNA (cytidine(1402)-2'-O)-methyltransferase [Candidatus Paceibacterota bacterium]|jgi:16S rRNA (cytidine1402-2'-O)-methyltransferase
MPKLYIIATPIGNLEDISARALRILSEADLILCEDTRNTQKILERFEIKKPLLSYHQHSKMQKIEYIIDLLKQDKNLALVSDAGTPGVSDPGNKLIESALAALPDLEIVPVPGPCALAAAASVCDFSMDKFLFLGFPPVKNKRKKYFEEVLASEYPVIFYESTYRIIKSLEEIAVLEKETGKNRKIVACRELTKKFETIYRGTAEEVVKILKEGIIKGEFVVVAGPDNSKI